MSWQATRYHDISCGHRVHNHESKCAHLHGHNYRIYFHCQAEDNGLDSIGRVIDFSDIKDRLCMWLEENWDHKFLAWSQDPLMHSICNSLDREGQGIGAKAADMLFGSIVVVPFNPTAENMARHLVEVIGPMQLENTGIALVRCEVEETRKCSASYTKERK
jgi:6-pyruvoyltetrahydropterin/6-carboxytetrahydropterin synthase